MSLLVVRQNQGSNCVPCGDPPPCNCGPNEQCILINKDCNTCSVNKCFPLDAASGSKGGISGGTVAGAVIAAVLFLVAVLLAYLWYRRRSKRAHPSQVESAKQDSPARAEDVLNRPDPNEKSLTPLPTPTIRGIHPYGEMIAVQDGQNSSAVGTQGHTPRQSQQSNPFDDRLDTQSIQTAGSVGTQSNVIPIALVGPDGLSARSNPDTLASTEATAGSAPPRPDRDPSLNLNLDPNASVGADDPRAASVYSASQVSGNVRHSYLSTGSYASDLLSEAPIIVTPGRGAVKQVLGVVKAEVIRTPAGSSIGGDSPPHSADSLRPSFSNRPPTRSPLAASSFGPADMLNETEEEHGQDLDTKLDPFGDEHSPFISGSQTSPSSPTPSASTFGSPAQTPSQYSSQAAADDWTPSDPSRPWANGSKTPRPDSMSTQAGSVIGASIGAATRLNVGNILQAPSSSSLDTPVSAALSSPRTPYRMTSAKLVSPVRSTDASSPLSSTGGAFEMQQRRAMQDLDPDRRHSRTSVMSSVSKADSILEAFPFVPPSPISDRPVRTPPRSPLAQQAFSDNSTVTTPMPKPDVEAHSHREVSDESEGEQRTRTKNNLPPPPALFNTRKIQGMSVASETSTMSNGLGSFPFQIDTGTISDAVPVSSQPQTVNGRQRASLDTLALTSDLASYPLGLDNQNLMDHYPGPKR